MPARPIVAVVIRWGPAIFWMALIFFISAQSTLPGVEDTLLDLLLKKGGHMAAYGILAALVWRALGAAPASGKLAGLAWLITILYAASDEAHQLFVPGRHGSLTDVAIDGAGAGIALIALWKLPRRRPRRGSNAQKSLADRP
jgi:VanZ family protein